MSTHAKKELRRKLKERLKDLKSEHKLAKSKVLSSGLHRFLSQHFSKMGPAFLLGSFHPHKDEEAQWQVSFPLGWPKLAYPDLVGNTLPGKMIFRECETHQLKIPENAVFPIPAPPRECLEVVPDCLLIPGLAFSALGARMGRGKGYYDAYCSKYPELPRVGICFEDQILPSIPMDSHDQTMDFVITDEQIYTCPPRDKSGHMNKKQN